MSITKKILNISIKVITWALALFTVFMMVFTIVSVTTLDRNDRSIFGMKLYIVQTDSMSRSENNKDMKVHFNAGDIIIVKEAENRTALKAGDIISFMSTNSSSYGETVTHMIREVKYDENGKLLGYVTFGTNTNTDDEALVEPEYILGVYWGKIPGAGNFFAFVRTTPGYIICILVPLLILILYNCINIIRLFCKYRREQLKEMQAERDKIDEERAENQRMMQELLALKAQLEKNGGIQSASAQPASEGSAEEATVENEESEG